MIRRPPRSTRVRSSAASDVYKRQDVGFRPAAMGDEGFLARRHHAHGGVGLARQQRGDQFDGERLGAAAEAAADMRPVSYTHLRAHETVLDLVCRLLLEKKKQH